MSNEPIQVYVELSGKDNYHENLKGRDEEAQHPINAITNLQESLDTLQQNIDNSILTLHNDIQSEMNVRFTGVFRLKGTVKRYADLPMDNNEMGDVWSISSTDIIYVWTGTEWSQSTSVELINYATKAYVQESIESAAAQLSETIQVLQEELYQRTQWQSI